MYLVRPPRLYRWLFPKAVFRKVVSGEPTVYLTFDDGPHPTVTPWVLDALAEHDVKATFFLLGENAKHHPQIVERIGNDGHQVGNHGMTHLNGWNTQKDAYVNNCLRGADLLGTDLFRPPYGRLGIRQYREIVRTQRIIMWDVIAGDFDTSTTPEKIIHQVLKNVRNGSIIVMHDSEKAMNNLKGSLNPIVTELKGKGYVFGLL